MGCYSTSTNYIFTCQEELKTFIPDISETRIRQGFTSLQQPKKQTGWREKFRKSESSVSTKSGSDEEIERVGGFSQSAPFLQKTRKNEEIEEETGERFREEETMRKVSDSHRLADFDRSLGLDVSIRRDAVGWTD